MTSDLFIPSPSGAVITPDGIHRYSLWRIWDSELPMVMFIGINPSTANETDNDRTVVRCINFANSWGYGGFYFGNLFSFRSRDAKKVVANSAIVVGAECDKYLKEMISKSDKVICAWGTWNWKFLPARAAEVLKFIPEPYCLGILSDGNPRHPLFSKADLKPIKYKP